MNTTLLPLFLYKRTSFPVIGVACSKGGVGKTTLTVNLGYEICAANRDWSVDILDLDYQQLNCVPYKETLSKHTRGRIRVLSSRVEKLNDLFKDLEEEVAYGVEVFSRPERRVQSKSNSKTTRPNGQSKARHRLVIMDLPAWPDVIQEALRHCDLCVCPFTPEIGALEGVGRMRNWAAGESPLFCVANGYAPQVEVHADVMREVRSALEVYDNRGAFENVETLDDLEEVRHLSTRSNIVIPRHGGIPGAGLNRIPIDLAAADHFKGSNRIPDLFEVLGNQVFRFLALHLWK